MQLAAQFLRHKRGFLHQMKRSFVEAICERITFERVAAGEAVIRQGDVGQAMYMLFEGTCDVYRRTSAAATDPGAPDPSIASPSPNCSAAPAGAIVAHHSDSPLCLADDLSYGTHVGVVPEGEIVGELALVTVDVPRNATVIAGAGGVELLGIDRALFAHFTCVGFSPVAGRRAHVAAAMRAACCRRILQIPQQLRTDQDVEALQSFLSGLQAFREIPSDVFAKLCKGMLFVHLPPQALVCEEDEPGDSMYVIMSGQCEVRATPPPVKPKAGPRVSAAISVAQQTRPSVASAQASEEAVVRCPQKQERATESVVCCMLTPFCCVAPGESVQGGGGAGA